MSGHSKWSTIKRAKGATDAKRSSTFTKLAAAITIAAKLGGGGDIDSNPRLRMAVEAARTVNMPKENIQRAMDRGLGKLPGQTIEEVLYEGFGPGKVAFIVEGLTDNKQRTTSDVKNMFDRSGGNMGAQGSVVHMFERVGEIRVKSKGGSSDEEILELIDFGAEDVEEDNTEGVKYYLVYTNMTELYNVSNKCTQSGFEVESSEIIYKPMINVEITDPETAQKVIAFTERLEDHDDIQRVYANFDIPESLIQ